MIKSNRRWKGEIGMAAVKADTTYSLKVVYKTSYDTTGELNLPSQNVTLGQVKETATMDQLKEFAKAVMDFTVYYEAPYVTQLIETSTLTEG